MGKCQLKIIEMAHVHRIINIYEKTLLVFCYSFLTSKAQNRWLKTRYVISSESALMLSFRYLYLELDQTDTAIKMSNHIYAFSASKWKIRLWQ